MLTIYKSSAGSGKTYTLVKEYLKLLIINPNHYKNILAVTFTNKATAEMKERVISKLAEVSAAGDESFIALLETETGIAKKIIVANAQLALQNILHNYSDFTIQTIDSFFNKTVRSLARELGLPLQFDVEMNQSFVIDYIVDSLMSEMGNDAVLAKHLETFALKKTDDDKGWNIELELQTIAAELFKEKFQQHVTDKEVVLYDEDVFEYVRKQIEIYKNTLIKFGKDFFAVLDNHALTENDFNGKSRSMCSFFKKLIVANFDKNKTVEDTLTGVKKWEAKDSPNKNIVAGLADSHFQNLLQQVVSYAEENLIKYNTCLAISKLQYVAALVQHLEEQLKKFRKENDVVMISDINRIVKKFISLSETPFIYEKTGSRYLFYLIDEFQDTSDFQWNNFLPLIENSLSEGNHSLVVGDVKQSIYRFRGGNMKLLHKQIRKDLRNFKDEINEQLLNTNYRSKSTIVNFNNQLFNHAPAVLSTQLNVELKDLFDVVYDSREVNQLVAAKNNSEGYVHVEFIDAKNNAVLNEDGDALPWKDIALKKLVETIQNLEEKNYRLGDIAILIRNNRDGVLIAEYLFENNYRNIITSDSLSLSTALQINILVNAFRLVHDSNNSVARVSLMHDFLHINQLQNIHSDQEIFADWETKSNSDFLFSKKELIEWRQLSNYELAETLVNKFQLNKKPDAYILRFYELLNELYDKNIYAVAGFLEWWEENSTTEACSVITQDNSNAIRIMTVHKSKGLQFPIVIMPFAEWDLKPRHENLLWVSTTEKPFDKVQAFPVNITQTLSESFFKDEYETELSETLIDNVNMLYVAFSRAEKQLYVFTPLKEVKESFNKNSQLLYSLISSVPEWSENFSNNIFHSGTCLANDDKQKKIDSSIQLEKLISNNWKEKVFVRTSPDENLLSRKISDKVDYGNIIHSILSNIIVKDDFENAVAKAILNWKLNAEDEKSIRQKISLILENEKTKTWWDGSYKIKTEASFVLPDGSQHRPDRIMFKENDVILVDYKTGVEKDSHKKQINEYSNTLSLMGYDVKGRYLFYVENMELVAA